MTGVTRRSEIYHPASDPTDTDCTNAVEHRICRKFFRLTWCSNCNTWSCDPAQTNVSGQSVIGCQHFLTPANRSFEYTIATTIFYRNHLLWWIIGVSTAISAAILFFPPMRDLFLLGPLNAGQIGLCLLAALASVGWFEVWKAVRRR